ncbi:tectonin beta-propeller repeat-containing protein 1-like [Diadema setosum]|uniref:tectonin beta-propeller repeat-containing protein 1-like n=1 Tax=Diadema setosum TaxID=31175 RepID=UPI003B3BAC19
MEHLASRETERQREERERVGRECQHQYLWAIGNSGKAYALSTESQVWELRSAAYGTKQVLSFKRISAARHVVWGLGSNLQPYIYVFGSDVPIRCLEYTYENQRWAPIKGYADKNLIFSDRSPWSDEKGGRLFPRPSDVRLPNKHWKWESDWHIDENFKGQPTGKGGWQYAVNFNTNDNYTSEKRWNSCVRRRKWIRYRKYIATDAWAQIKGIHSDPLEEPLMELSVGGHELPGQSEGYLSVWAISALGKVFCRVGVTRKNPEGYLWREVFTSEGKGLLQLSVGPTGVVWGVTWDGQGVIRIGVSRDHPLGTSWTYVSPPEKGLLASVTMGNNVVWALTRDKKVWFRKGFMSTVGNENRSNREGTSWIEMFGQVGQLSVGPNDQVWALTAEDRPCLVFRSGVSYEELSGREWKSIVITDKNDTGYHDDSISIAESLASYSISLSGKMQYLDVNNRFARSVSDPSGLSMMDEDMSGPSVLGDEFMHNGKLVRTMCVQTDDGILASAVSGIYSQFEDSLNSYTDIQGQSRTMGSSLSLSSYNRAKEAQRQKDSDRGSALPESAPPKGLTVDEVHNQTPVEGEKPALARQPSYHSDFSDTPINYITDYDEEDSSENPLAGGGSEKGTQTDNLPDCVQSLPGALVGPDVTMDLRQLLQQQSHQATSTTGIPESVEGEDRRYRKDSTPELKFSISSHDLAVDPSTMSDANHKAMPTIMVDSGDRLYGRRKLLCLAHARQQMSPHLFPRRAESPLPYSDSMVDLSTTADEEEEVRWSWVSGGGCVVEPTSLPKWFYQATLSQQSFRHRLQEGAWRGSILKLLRRRREEEVKGYEHYPCAVERSSWAKMGAMQWCSEGRRRQWVDCTIELERGMDGTGRQQSRFSVHFQPIGKQKLISFLLSEITCVVEVNNSSERPSFCIYTPKRVLDRKPISLRVNNDKELREWVAAISMACNEVRGIYGAPSPRAAWLVTCRGDVFIHETLPNMQIAPSSHLYWRQIGGHMASIECCGAGVVWGLGLDHTPWVYTGGYGGGVFKGIASSTFGIQPQTDSKNLYVYEKQRWSPLSGFTDRGMWTTESDKMLESRDLPLPSPHWQWISDWKVDFSISGSTDKEGWQYAKEFKNTKAFHKDRRWNDYVRRRRWVRRCQITTSGPWKQIQNLALRDVSLQVDVDDHHEGPIALWAIGANGDVVTRLGVTSDCPEGTAWMHVPTDQPFQSISVGGKYQIWAVARDGSAFFRNGVSDSNRTGETWFHIAPPSVAPLKQISVGMSSAWAIDAQMNLWFRQDITPTFPEGTRWIQVSPKVRKVSVGPQDQVWIVADQVDGARGVVCRRDGITANKRTGTAWDKGAGGGIMHLCVRGCTKEEEKELEVEDSAMATIHGSTLEARRQADPLRPYISSDSNAVC